MKRALGRIYESFERLLGITFRLNKSVYKNNLSYQYGIAPYAKYAPWKGDKEFNKIYDLVIDHTLISEYPRIYELWQLCAEVKDLEGDYIEIGTWRGGSGCLIGYRANSISQNSSVYLCDTFEGVVKSGTEDSTYTDGEHSDTSDTIVKELISTLSLKNIEVLKGIFPDDTGHLVENNRFKFCHIDVDVFEGAKSITEWIWPKLVIGGILVYDDFGFIDMPGVTKFVESQRQMKDRHVIHNLNGHGIIIKLSN